MAMAVMLGLALTRVLSVAELFAVTGSAVLEVTLAVSLIRRVRGSAGCPAIGRRSC